MITTFLLQHRWRCDIHNHSSVITFSCNCNFCSSKDMASAIAIDRIPLFLQSQSYQQGFRIVPFFTKKEKEKGYILLSNWIKSAYLKIEKRRVMLILAPQYNQLLLVVCSLSFLRWYAGWWWWCCWWSQSPYFLLFSPSILDPFGNFLIICSSCISTTTTPPASCIHMDFMDS